jgi:uncharacterized protein
VSKKIPSKSAERAPMEFIEVVETEEPKLLRPVFVEGLPGVGNVGKLAAEHLIDELGATKFAEIYCKDFPPQVLVSAGGEIRLVSNSLYYWKAKKKTQRDLILLTGDFQALSSAGQYDIVDRVLNILHRHGCQEIYTLGGFGLGRMVEKPSVLGAATSKAVIKRLSKFKVRFKEEEPGGGIIGASGLFLGLGKVRGLEGACLMGETSGYLVDPKSAQAVLQVLTKVLGVDITFTQLEAKAREMDRISSQLRDMERKQEPKSSDELRYIG